MTPTRRPTVVIIQHFSVFDSILQPSIGRPGVTAAERQDALVTTID